MLLGEVEREVRYSEHWKYQTKAMLRVWGEEDVEVPKLQGAKCRGLGTELFFKPANYDKAKQVCARCPVKQECADFAYQEKIKDGIWGGMDPEERAALNQETAQ